MRKGIVAGLALSLLLVGACSSDSNGGGTSSGTIDCDNAKSKCPNDPPLDPALCKQLTNDPKCGKVFTAALLCIGDHQTCKSDGTTDTSVSDRECASQQAAAAQCSPADGGP
jgi:hypothetical protein